LGADRQPTQEQNAEQQFSDTARTASELLAVSPQAEEVEVFASTPFKG
jgi:hypothetical protein